MSVMKHIAMKKFVGYNLSENSHQVLFYENAPLTTEESIFSTYLLAV